MTVKEMHEPLNFNIFFRGKRLKTKGDLQLALITPKSYSEKVELQEKLNAIYEIKYTKEKAQERYDREKDPYLKNQMKHFLEKGEYNFDYLFGPEK